MHIIYLYIYIYIDVFAYVSLCQQTQMCRRAQDAGLVKGLEALFQFWKPISSHSGQK